MAMPSSPSLPEGVDIMNDPIADPTPRPTAKRNDSISEPDHCRICRSEGTDEEPLFHPCKCSGSIKFVHQDCLTEWLKHSQKKHCELCKTPFRFTNVYDPNMPEQIPPLVFAVRVTRQIGRTALFWARCVLVCMVWLGWLPWCVRWMWRFWFWLGDADWVARSRTSRDITQLNATSAAISALAKETITSSGTILSGNATDVFKDRSENLMFAKFGNFTSSPFVNKLLFDIVEGQALAVAIFSCFFIVFLVREWVIQQQPEPGLADHIDLAPRQLENIPRNRDPRPEPAPAPAAEGPDRDARGQPFSLAELLANAELRRAEKEAREEALEELDSSRELDGWEGNASEAGSGDDQADMDQTSTGNSSFEIVENPSSPEPTTSQFTIRQPSLPSNQRLAEAAASSGSSIPRFDFGASSSATEWNSDGASKAPMFTFGAQANDSSSAINFQAGEGSSSSQPAVGRTHAEWLRDIEDRLHAPSRSSDVRPKDSTDSVSSAREQASADQNDGVRDQPIDLDFHFDQTAVDQDILDEFDFDNHEDDSEDDEGDGPGANEGINEDDFNAQDDGMGLDDGDDMDGVLELMGMRGPIVVLAQNAIISIVLLTVAVGMGVAVPYCWGRIVLLVLAHPTIFFLILPISLASFVGEFIVDTGTFAVGTVLLVAETSVRWVLKFASTFVPALSPVASATAVHNFIKHHVLKSQSQVALKLYGKVLVSGKATPVFRNIRPGYLPLFSNTSRLWWTKLTAASYWAADKLQSHGSNISFVNATQAAGQTAEKLRAVAQWSEKWTGINGTTAMLDMDPYAPSYTWTAKERVLAVVAGYAFFTFLGALYLANSRASGDHRRAFERSLVDLLQQAGGVMKVILIIGVEMMLFPLFCGVLLDIALLPLFENATLASRVSFGLNYPFTAVFLHWFVGTAYMFHFALFVAMCRRIMRNGVLYFIRDPDDPTFHPVKDVLDRPVLMQLRKIAYSALIYGFLVLFCLGSVVWGLHYSFNVLPIHWSSNEPVLEFPVDLLLYNFLMPVAVEHFQPSEGLEMMYGWWFRKCARLLRLTSFLFGGRIYDEEVKLKSSNIKLVFWRLVNEPVQEEVEDEEEAKKNDKKEKKPKPTKEELIAQMETISPINGDKECYVRDGKYVRAPAADSVRRAKGQVVFIPVTEDNKRLDGKKDVDEPETSPEGEKFAQVWIPPHFRARLGLLVVLVWSFAAVTGVGVTIGPLIIGRAMLSALVPLGLRTNDVYAFSIGIYILGAFAFVYSRREIVFSWSKSAVQSHTIDWSYIYKAAKLSYIIAAFTLLIPSLFALLIELYIIMPLHTILHREETHVIHFIQDWTLGVLYIKLLLRWILLDEESYYSRSLRSIIEPGYLNPDIKLATERFIAPAALGMGAALAVPAGITFAGMRLLGRPEPAVETLIYRYAYPAVFFAVAACGGVWSAKGWWDSWRQNIRDEVYSIGQQLHNHGESVERTAPAVVAPVQQRRRSLAEETRPLLAAEDVTATAAG